MQELTELLVRWAVNPERTVTDSHPLDQAEAADATADGRARGKVAVVWA